MFLSTFEKQLDAKRRLLIPGDFRTAENGAEHGIFLFPSIEADCLEAGGDHLFAVYNEMIQSLPFGSEERSALEWQVMGEQVRLAYDSGGRITLPEHLCVESGLSGDVVIVGLNDRFQIWAKDKYEARRAEQRARARASLSQISKARLDAQTKLAGGGQ
nr:division/cell wall cluster transcriptional repressor MraZ [uncultured Brevundimonas sp.]